MISEAGGVITTRATDFDPFKSQLWRRTAGCTLPRRAIASAQGLRGRGKGSRTTCAELARDVATRFRLESTADVDRSIGRAYFG